MVDLDTKQNHWPALVTGAVFGALLVLSAQRLFAPDPELPTIQRTPASQIVEAYKAGIEDAVRTNPPSWQLEEACLEVWANKQPTQ
jgi:hypothetical protein